MAAIGYGALAVRQRCDHADGCSAFCIANRMACPSPVHGGVPPLKIVVLPAKGLADRGYVVRARAAGYGSHHIALNDVWVPERMSSTCSTVTECGGPLFQGAPAFFVTTHCAFALGLARAPFRIWSI